MTSSGTSESIRRVGKSDGFLQSAGAESNPANTGVIEAGTTSPYKIDTRTGIRP